MSSAPWMKMALILVRADKRVLLSLELGFQKFPVSVFIAVCYLQLKNSRSLLIRDHRGATRKDISFSLRAEPLPFAIESDGDGGTVGSSSERAVTGQAEFF